MPEQGKITTEQKNGYFLNAKYTAPNTKTKLTWYFQ